MKKKTKIITIILILIVLTITFSVKSYGSIIESFTDGIGSFVDGVAGILLYPSRLFPLLLGDAINIILGLATNGTGLTCSIEDVIFGKVDITNINFFSSSITGTSQIIASNIAIWYTSLRNIAIVGLVIIAVYVGIKMAISTVADDQAKYKKMLIDWLTSLALLFVLQYIMIFIIGINDALVMTLSKALTNSGTGDTKLFNVTEELRNNGYELVPFTEGAANAIGYALVSVLTLIFLMIYIKRMVTIAFLIIISPLVTITYAIDKMKDGKSQALDTWLKEFTYNILIQPFHCVSYLALGTVATDVMAEGGLFNAIVGIVILAFVLKSEDIVKHIFHFESQSMGSAIAQTAFMGTLFSKASSGAKAASGGKSKNKFTSNSNSKNSNAGSTANNGTSATKNGASAANNGVSVANNGVSVANNGAIAANNGASATKNGTSATKNGTSAANNEESTTNNGGTLMSKLGSFGKGLLKANIRTGLAMAGIGFGAATGDLKGVYAGLNAGISLGKKASSKVEKRSNEKKLAKEFNNYASSTSSEQAIQDGMNMFNGTKEPDQNNREQMKYYSSIMDEVADLKRNGVSDDDMEDELKSKLESIQNGKISEFSKPEKAIRHFYRKTKKGASTIHTKARTSSANTNTSSENTNTSSENTNTSSENANTSSENTNTSSENANSTDKKDDTSYEENTSTYD